MVLTPEAEFVLTDAYAAHDVAFTSEVIGAGQFLREYPMAAKKALTVAREDLARCAFKLIETFAVKLPGEDRFERYWRLAPLLEAFAETASSPVEQELTEHLRAALEHFLRDRAVVTGNIHGPSVTALLGCGWRNKKYKPSW